MDNRGGESGHVSRNMQRSVRSPCSLQ